MRTLAASLFAVGILLAVRVMFFGVRGQSAAVRGERAAPLAIAATLLLSGATLSVLTSVGIAVTAAWLATVLLVGLAGGVGAWWLVRASAAAAAVSVDPEDDPRYRFQGHVARVVQPIGASADGRVEFEYDGDRFGFPARWLAGNADPALGAVDREVVIERVDDGVAFVEPWALVEGRL